jgi:hypothetical protein
MWFSLVRLLPWVRDGKTGVRPGMEDARVRKPPTRQALDTLSGHPVPLAASAEHAEPQPFDLLAKGFQPSPIQRHRMIRIVGPACAYARGSYIGLNG